MLAYTTLIYDMQVQLCFRYWNGEVPMPSEQEMLADTNHDMTVQYARQTKGRAHLLGDRQVGVLFKAMRIYIDAVQFCCCLGRILPTTC